MEVKGQKLVDDFQGEGIVDGERGDVGVRVDLSFLLWLCGIHLSIRVFVLAFKFLLNTLVYIILEWHALCTIFDSVVCGMDGTTIACGMGLLLKYSQTVGQGLWLGLLFTVQLYS